MADSFFDGPIADDRAEEIQRLREALEAKTRELEAQQDRYLRTVAEFDNVRKRATREREVTAGHVRGQVIPDPEVDFVKWFLAALWRLCEQEVATVTGPTDPEVGGTIYHARCCQCTGGYSSPTHAGRSARHP